MEAIEIIVIVACVLIVGGVIASHLINKKKGKNSCCSDCSSCSYCNSCNKKDEIKK